MSFNTKTPILSFDLDGTLMKPGFGDKVWLEGLPKVYADVHNISYEKAKNYLRNSYDKIGRSRREWYDLSYWITKLKLPITPDQLLEQFSPYIEPYPEVPDLINRLSKKYVLIVSSAAMKQFIKIELQTAKLVHYFSNFFSATSDTQTVKKNPFFYQMIIKKLNCKPTDIVHVGDDKQFDYFSPKKIGLHAFYLDRTKEDTSDDTISSLMDFETKLKQYPFE